MTPPKKGYIAEINRITKGLLDYAKWYREHKAVGNYDSPFLSGGLPREKIVAIREHILLELGATGLNSVCIAYEKNGGRYKKDLRLAFGLGSRK